MSEARKKYLKNLIENTINSTKLDTSVPDQSDVKGPMLDPILKYDGTGQLPTYQDVSQILQRYYNQEQEENLDFLVSEHEDNEIDEVPTDVAKSKDQAEEEIEGDEDVLNVESTVLNRIMQEIDEEGDEDEEEDELDVDSELSEVTSAFIPRKKIEDELEEAYEIFNDYEDLEEDLDNLEEDIDLEEDIFDLEEDLDNSLEEDLELQEEEDLNNSQEEEEDLDDELEENLELEEDLDDELEENLELEEDLDNTLEEDLELE